MATLPEVPNLDHLKKQAKDLLRLYEAGDRAALERFRASLPAAAGKKDSAIAALGLRLHDAQSCIAREYGFPSWGQLKTFVEWRANGGATDRQRLVSMWLYRVYGHEAERPRPAIAARMLDARPDIAQGDLLLCCASGDEAGVRQFIAADPACVNRPSEGWLCPQCKRPFALPPLAAVTHSSMLRLAEYRERLHRCARLLIEAGADVNQAWMDGEYPLSALYGAAGKNHDPELTQMLLNAGANPNDNESLYHSTEAWDLTCTRLLLEAGAKVEGTNAIHHQLDRDDLEGLRLLLAYTKDVDEVSRSLGSPLFWAARRGRSRAHIEALLQAGANPQAASMHGMSLYRLALRYGLADAADLLRVSGTEEELSLQEQFVAACACCNRQEALRILAAHPDVINTLSDGQRRQLPNLVESGRHDAARLMVELGWPIDITGGDWSASALNLAVFQGNSELTRFLLEHGASWEERHGHGDNVRGTLSWASRNNDAELGDWVGCAEALVEHGMPIPEDLRGYSEEVAAYFADARGVRGDATIDRL